MPNQYTGRGDAGRSASRPPVRTAQPSARPAPSRYGQAGSSSRYGQSGGRYAQADSSRYAPNGGRYAQADSSRYAQNGGRYGQAPGRPASPAGRPRGSGSRRGGGGGQLPPLLKLLCFALVALLCVGVTVKITSSLTRDRRQQTVSYADGSSGTTAEPTVTDAPDTPGQSATDEPEWEQPEADPTDAPSDGLRRATIRTCGDVIMHQPLLETALSAGGGSAYSFDNYFSTIASTMSNADWTVINIEATLRKNKYGYAGYPQFSTPPSILSTLSACGVDMLTMCNNHMLDGFWDGLRESIGLVEDAGLAHVGAYATQEAYNTPEILEICGIKVGFLNYTQSTNTMETKSDKAATEYGFRYISRANFAQQVQALRDAGAEVVVGYMHWGEEYERTPESSTQKYAKQLVAAGVDIVIGGHPHVVQPCEYVTATAADGTTRTALVVYSIGNFISDQRLQYRDSGIIFEFTIEEQPDGSFAITRPAYIPTYVWRWGSDDTGYDYRILPIGQYMDAPPAGMSEADYTRMKECWYEIYAQMGGDSVCTALAG